MTGHRPHCVVVGPASVDRYIDSGADVPGGGALNMAYHWARRGVGAELVTRVATRDADLFVPFFEHNGISVTPSLLVDGPSCTVDVVIRADRQPWMDHFVEGIWSDFAFSDREAALVLDGTPTHLVLVDVVDRALLELVSDDGSGAGGGTSRLAGDFLSFRHFTPERFAGTFSRLEIGFIGWPGSPADPVLDELAAHVETCRNVLVVTFGSHGVRAYDGRADRPETTWFDVEAVPVRGTTVGCGDAFISGFLAEWWATGELARAVDAGRELGAAATGWTRPLPDDAYRGVDGP